MCVNTLNCRPWTRSEKKIGANESFDGPAASLLPAKDLTVDARIENGYGGRGREVFACPERGASVYSWEIHRGARVPPRVEPVPFGQKNNFAAVHPPGAKLSYQRVSGAGLIGLGRNDGTNGAFD